MNANSKYEAFLVSVIQDNIFESIEYIMVVNKKIQPTTNTDSEMTRTFMFAHAIAQNNYKHSYGVLKMVCVVKIGNRKNTNTENVFSQRTNWWRQNQMSNDDNTRLFMCRYHVKTIRTTTN